MTHRIPKRIRPSSPLEAAADKALEAEGHRKVTVQFIGTEPVPTVLGTFSPGQTMRVWENQAIMLEQSKLFRVVR